MRIGAFIVTSHFVLAQSEAGALDSCLCRLEVRVVLPPVPPCAEEWDAVGREEQSDEPSPAPPTPEVYFKSTDGYVGT